MNTTNSITQTKSFLPAGYGAWDVTVFPFGGDFIRPSEDIEVTNVRPSMKEGYQLADCQYPDRKGVRTICTDRIYDDKSARGIIHAIRNDEFTTAYIEAALFTSTDDSGEPLDREYSREDIHASALETMIADCARFRAENDISGYGDKQAGHDFLFTRNGHGAGFWENDHGTPKQCALLDKAAKAFGEFNLYIGDDGEIYGA